MIRGPWFVGCPPVEERVGVCAPAQIFRGRCAGFFAHLRSGYFSFWFCKSQWFLGLGVEGNFGEGDAQVFCERLKGTTTTRRHDGGRERGGAKDAEPARRDLRGKFMRTPYCGQWAVVSCQWTHGACFYRRGGGPCLCAQVWREELVGLGREGS